MPHTIETTRRWRGPFFRALLAIWAGAATGCASSEPILGGGYEIDEVRLEGVQRFSKGQLLSHLYAGETTWVPLTPDYPFDEALLVQDARRLAALYRSYGYHGAIVHEVEATPDADAMEVDLRIRVTEGEPTRVSSVRYVWDPTAVIPHEDKHGVINDALGLESGDPFEVAKLNDTLGALRLALLTRGYPLAEVQTDSQVDPGARTAAVRFRIAPGPFARIGAIAVEGLDDVPRYMVDRELAFAIGAPYSPALVSQMEQMLRAMRVFRWVAAQPTIEVEDGRARLRIAVSEADPQSILLGVAASLETIRWQEQLRIDYVHTNLFGHLTRLDLEMVLGWAQLPNPWRTDIDGPVVVFSPVFTKKGLLEDQLQWRLNPRFDVNVYEGYQYLSPSNVIGVSRWIAGFLNVDLSHNYRHVDFFNVSPELDSKRSILGRDFRDPFSLSSLELKLKAYFVDSLIEPDEGLIVELGYGLDGSFFGSSYDFHQLDAKVRAYWRPFSRLQIAAQLRSGLIIPFGEDPSSPFSHRYYLGGADTVRGWGSRRLSPRIEECDELDGSCSQVPIGGQTLVQANLELRLRLFWKLSIVAFGDVGDVQADATTWNLDEWNYTAGGGLRVDTPLGLVRLDFGYRLNDPGVFQDEERWAIHFGLGETF